MKRALLTIATLAIAVLSSSSASAAHHVDWNDWSFDVGVYGHSGLELRYVTRRGRSVLYQASFPVMRVDYAPGSCNESPFADLITPENILPRFTIANLDAYANWCGEKICARTYSAAGANWMELSVLANEGNYLIYQAWYLSDRGEILARVYSKGEQCPNATHRHHPYWRFDFDVGPSVFG